MNLRTLTKSDLPFLLEIRNHESTRVNLENDSEFTLEECEKWFELKKPNWLVIEVDGQSVGYVRIDGEYVGVDVHMEHRRRGYANQAFIEYLKNKELAKLWVFNDNFAKQLYLKLGFAESGNVQQIRGRSYVEMIYRKRASCRVGKVLAFYFGDRRHYPYNKKGVLELLDKQIEAHSKFNPAVPMDLIIVNHDVEDSEVYEALNRYDGYKISTGKVVIVNRKRINADLSFGSYKYAFHLLQDTYDYWFFSEDDIIPSSHGLVSELIDILESDPLVGFVGALKFHGIHEYTIEDNYISRVAGHSPHIHGGVGLTSREKIKIVAKQIPEYLQTPNIEGKAVESQLHDYVNGSGLEIGFTYDFVRAGFKLKVKHSENNLIRAQTEEKL